MKKILKGLFAASATLSPLAALVSCSPTRVKALPSSTELFTIIGKDTKNNKSFNVEEFKKILDKDDSEINNKIKDFNKKVIKYLYKQEQEGSKMVNLYFGGSLLSDEKTMNSDNDKRLDDLRESLKGHGNKTDEALLQELKTNAAYGKSNSREEALEFLTTQKMYSYAYNQYIFHLGTHSYIKNKNAIFVNLPISSKSKKSNFSVASLAHAKNVDFNKHYKYVKFDNKYFIVKEDFDITSNVNDMQEVIKSITGKASTAKAITEVQNSVFTQKYLMVAKDFSVQKTIKGVLDDKQVSAIKTFVKDNKLTYIENVDEASAKKEFDANVNLDKFKSVDSKIDTLDKAWNNFKSLKWLSKISLSKNGNENELVIAQSTRSYIPSKIDGSDLLTKFTTFGKDIEQTSHFLISLKQDEKTFKWTTDAQTIKNLLTKDSKGKTTLEELSDFKGIGINAKTSDFEIQSKDAPLLELLSNNSDGTKKVGGSLGTSDLIDTVAAMVPGYSLGVIKINHPKLGSSSIKKDPAILTNIQDALAKEILGSKTLKTNKDTSVQIDALSKEELNIKVNKAMESVLGTNKTFDILTEIKPGTYFTVSKFGFHIIHQNKISGLAEVEKANKLDLKRQIDGDAAIFNISNAVTKTNPDKVYMAIGELTNDAAFKKWIKTQQKYHEPSDTSKSNYEDADINEIIKYQTAYMKNFQNQKILSIVGTNSSALSKYIIDGVNNEVFHNNWKDAADIYKSLKEIYDTVKGLV